MAKILDKVAAGVSAACASALALVRVALLSRRVTGRGVDKGDRRLVVLGNGPSLRDVLDNPPEWLRDSDLMAVNFAANTPMFAELRPQYYVLADPHFFGGKEDTDPNVVKLWENLRLTRWPMTLCVPASEKERAALLAGGNEHIDIRTFNLTPAEGWEVLTHLLFRMGLAMPRPRNVMIPSIMTGIREGYRHILLAGADHSWLQSLYVDEGNHVVSVQPHFYADNEKEQARVRSEYAGYHLHDILESMTVAFRSYHEIAAYAFRRGVLIENATPGSYIDAFPRL